MGRGHRERGIRNAGGGVAVLNREGCKEKAKFVDRPERGSEGSHVTTWDKRVLG